MFEPKISVIIPTINRNEILVNTLKDLLKQNYTDFEIIIVDQTENPKKEVLRFCKKNIKKIKYFQISKKSSPHARNVAVQNADGDILLFVDDDVEIPGRDFLKLHADNYKDRKIGLVGGRIVYGDEEPAYQEVGRLKYWGLKEVTHFDSTVKTRIDHAAGGNFSCYKSIFVKVGGFNEIYGGNAHMEETDFCLRVKRAGYKMVFEPKAVLKHLQFKKGGNRVKDLYELRYWLVHNGTVFYLKNFPKILFPLYFIKQLFWSTFSGLKRQDGKMFKTMSKALIKGINYYLKMS